MQWGSLDCHPSKIIGSNLAIVKGLAVYVPNSLTEQEVLVKYATCKLKLVSLAEITLPKICSKVPLAVPNNVKM